MTVQELIDELEKVEDKELEVYQNGSGAMLWNCADIIVENDIVIISD